MMEMFTQIAWGQGSMRNLRLAPIGKIKIGRKGEERTSGGGGKYRLPEKLDHFLITTRARGADDNFMEVVAVDARNPTFPTVGMEVNCSKQE